MNDVNDVNDMNDMDAANYVLPTYDLSNYTPREKAMLAEQYEAEQILGRALGYPAYGPEMFPDGIPNGDVCVGEHTIVTLALEIAAKTEQLLAGEHPVQDPPQLLGDEEQ